MGRHLAGVVDMTENNHCYSPHRMPDVGLSYLGLLAQTVITHVIIKRLRERKGAQLARLACKLWPVLMSSYSTISLIRK